MKGKVDFSATVLRALKVLNHLKELPGPQSVSYISNDLELSPTIVHRLLTTLKMEGFVFQDPQSKLYSLGSAFLEYADKILMELPFAPIIEPWLIQLRNFTGETSAFYIPSGHTRLCLMEYESNQEIKCSVGVGEQMPIYSGASGLAILSFQSEQIQTQILKNLAGETKSMTHRKIRETREKGYAVNIEELAANVAAIAVPVFDHQNRVLGTVAISGPSFRFDNEKIKIFTSHLLDAASAISEAFQ